MTYALGLLTAAAIWLYTRYRLNRAEDVLLLTRNKEKAVYHIMRALLDVGVCAVVLSVSVSLILLVVLPAALAFQLVSIHTWSKRTKPTRRSARNKLTV